MTDFSESAERISDREPSYGRSTGLVLGQLTGNKGPAPGIVACRRASHERRRRRVSAFLYGNFRPRRRHARRADDHHVWFDWHEPRVLYLALGVLLLSCTDALFTLNLLVLGAEEANSVMNVLLGRSIDLFLAVKISLTAFAVIVLVAAAHRPFLGLFRVVRLLQLALVGYIVLIAYELWMFTAVFGVSLDALGFGASLPSG